MRMSGPSFADWLIGFLAGPDMCEAIVGDLHEQAQSSGAPRRSMVIVTLRALPGLVHLGLSNISAHRYRVELGWMLGLLAAAWAWELNVAQSLAWPVASSISTISPFSIVITCKLAYLTLFALGLIVLMGGWHMINRASKPDWRVRTQRFGATVLAGLVPVLYLLTFPGPYDGHPAFRFVQLALIGLVAVTGLLVSRSMLQRA
ncbi:MAG: hypothetical protein AAGK35_11085 [Pseudomonadota bacterium]